MKKNTLFTLIANALLVAFILTQYAFANPSTDEKLKEHLRSQIPVLQQKIKASKAIREEHLREHEENLKRPEADRFDRTDYLPRSIKLETIKIDGHEHTL